MGKLSVRAENVRLPRAEDPPSQVANELTLTLTLTLAVTVTVT